MPESQKCNHHSTNVPGIQCVSCAFSHKDKIQKSAQEFVQLLKHEKFKQTKSHIKKLSSLPRIGPRIAKVLHMKLVDGLTYKQIGEHMGFSGTRSHQLYAKGIYFIEQASKNKKN